MERIPTGIDGLDTMLRGGLIPGRPYLVTGGPGVGKTIFCMQFLMKGVEMKERGLYVALEEQADQLNEDMSEFGWDMNRIKILDTMQDVSSGMWTLKAAGIVSRPEFTLKNLIETLREKIHTYKPKRLVIDSLTSIKMLYSNETDARRELLGLMNFLLASGCTTLMTCEKISNSLTMEEFLTSGSVSLSMIHNEGERLEAISVTKMRGSGFDKHVRPMKITENGIEVFPNESVFS